MSKGKIIAAVVGLLVVAGIVAAVVLGKGASAPEVTVERAGTGALTVTVSASGKTEADAKRDIFPPAAGMLESISVTEGASVKEGDIIATMDTTPFELQIAQAQAAYEGALAQADSISQSAPSSADEKAASASVSAAYGAYNAALSQYNALKSATPDAAAITQAEAAVAAAQLSYDAAQTAYDTYKTTVYDPATLPRDAAMETALAALSLARDQAAANLANAQRSLALLVAGQDKTAALVGAKTARDQAWAAYQGALAQQAKLAGADTSAAQSSASAGARAARAALDYAVSNLEKATMRAPMDGTVIFNGGASASLAAAGLGGSGKPSVGSAVSPASAPFSVVLFDQLVFNAQVDEADIDKVKPGMKVKISLDALTAETFEAEVERIDKTSVVTPTGGTAFSVLIRLKNVNDRVLLGMNGSVDIEVESIGEAVTVPVEAVLDEGGKSYLFLAQGGKAVRTEVTTGRTTDTRAEVLTGLKAGDEVIVTGIGSLKDGVAIRVK
ncbi:MAG: RND family efflux transporter MFP [Actinobacteria bacterium]|nr:MAG: RND family efflux transporter MFP [Actinomycetota bacterium]MDO8949808.1 efflux RND transporter periplasmic adaptor subunit [Actinomycetota bacterium]